MFEKMQRFFVDGVVKLDDKIVGRKSGIERQIDVSVRLRVEDTEVLYVFECKDWTTRVNINALGALSAVMEDVGASKGFLLCSVGFCKSNHKYALSQGIELITIEDIKSDKWTVEVQVPFVYVQRANQIGVALQIRVTHALAELNRTRELKLDLGMATAARAGRQSVATTLERYTLERVMGIRVDSERGVRFELTNPYLELLLAGVWVPCAHLSVVLSCMRRRYLKYLTPTEYSQVRDHVRGTITPLELRLDDVGLQLDDTFVEMRGEDLPVAPGLWLEAEEEVLSLDRPTGCARGN